MRYVLFSAIALVVVTVMYVMYRGIGNDLPETMRHVMQIPAEKISKECRLDNVVYSPVIPVHAPLPVKMEVTGIHGRHAPRAKATIVAKLNGAEDIGSEVTLYYGIGSAVLTLPRPGVWGVSVRVNKYVTQDSTEDSEKEGGCSQTFPVEAVDLRHTSIPVRKEAGTSLSVGKNEGADWSKGIIIIEGSLKIPEGVTLIVRPGVVIVMSPGSRLDVVGQVKMGEEGRDPVLFTALPDEEGKVKPWDQVVFHRGSKGDFHNTWLTHGGSTKSPNVGSLDTTPVLHVQKNAAVTFNGGGLIDNVGEAIRGEVCNIVIQGTVIARCAGGGSAREAVVKMDNIHVTEISLDQRIMADFTKDAFSFFSPRTITDPSDVSVISNSVFAVGGGLGINHKGSNFIVQSTIVENFHRACVLTSDEKSKVTLKNMILRNCAIGLRVGYGKMNVTLENSVVVNNKVGIWYGEDGVDNMGTLDIHNVLAMGNSEKNLKVYSDGAERINTDRGSDNVRLRCFFVNTESTTRTPKSRFSLPQRMSQKPCRQPQIYLDHPECHINAEVPRAECLWTDYSPEPLVDARLERIDLCANCCQETAQELAFGSYDHWRLKAIQDLKDASISTEGSAPGAECGLSFSADFYQYSDSQCLKSKIRVKSVFSNISHNQAESHLRELKTYYFDRVLQFHLTPPSFGLMLDFSHILDSNASAFIDQTMSCGLSDNDGNQVSTFVTAWVPDIGMYTKLSVQLADLVHPKNFYPYVVFLYLSNCMKSGHSHFASKDTFDYILIDNDRCFVPERVAALNFTLHYRKRLLVLTDTLFSTTHVCDVPADMINKFKHANAISSKVPSLGSQLREEIIKDEEMGPLILKEDPEIYEEIDGRVSILLAHYHRNCDEYDPDKYNPILTHVYKTGAIQYAYMVQGRDYMIAKFEDDHIGYLKAVGKSVRQRIGGEIMNGGFAELVAYHVDRLMELGRTPVVASRRLFLDDSLRLKGIIEPDGELLHDYTLSKVTLEKFLSEVRNEDKDVDETIRWVANQMKAENGAPFLDIVVVGRVKSLRVDTDLNPKIKDFLAHRITFNDLEDAGVTRQMTWDITNTIVFDFLTHNPERTGLAMSELRHVIYDNRPAFSPSIPTAVCDSILHCHPALYPPPSPSPEPDASTACPAECWQEDADKTALDGNCRFRKHVLERFYNYETNTSRADEFVDSLKKAIAKETLDVQSIENYFGQVDLYTGLKERISYFLRHVEKCRKQYGDDTII
ncbi:Hypp5177 [Branchiostoma lanceolatum]|uniref:Hypp5177 protein n=1 Tax=Branchiostoma lanceolatum TaxID=7740 RepID=A0A8K0AE60_BRALA|nr:Hypp5177 [Branchiostoma lanceolatum]